MGMDVIGKAPTSDHGKYFRRNIWGWHPLADAVQKIAPEICAKCKYWHYNDGDGLDDKNSRALARAIRNHNRIKGRPCKCSLVMPGFLFEILAAL
jgi:hypothetical protein